MWTTRFFRFFRYLNGATFKETLVRSGHQRLPGLSAEIAFNATLAMFPATVAMLTVVGMVGASQSAFELMAGQLSRVAPMDVLNLVGSFIQEISPASTQGLFSISFLAAIWIASGAVNSAMSALDQIHKVPPRLRRPFWKSKLVSIGLTLGTMLLFLGASVTVFVSEVVIRILANQSDQLVGTIARQPNVLEPQVLRLWSRLSMPIALGMVAVAFAFIYRYGPSRWLKGTPILPGAMLATIFWALFSGIFRLYVANFGNYNRVYGAVGAVIVLLIWLQLSALTMLIGAQLNFTVGAAMRRNRRSLSDRAQYRQQNTGKNQTPENRSRHKA
jgi:membrane protein